MRMASRYRIGRETIRQIVLRCAPPLRALDLREGFGWMTTRLRRKTAAIIHGYGSNRSPDSRSDAHSNCNLLWHHATKYDR